MLQDFEDPFVKATKDYGLEKVKDIWSTYTQYGGYIGYNGRTNYGELIELAQGRPSMDSLRNLLIAGASSGQVQGFHYFDLQVLNLAPKFINLVKGKLNKINYDIIITALDPVSLDEKKAYENKAKAYLYTKEWLATIGADAKQLFSDINLATIPEEPDALVIDMQINYKHKEAMKDEILLKEIHEANNWVQIKSEVDWDLVVLGIGCTRAYLDKSGYAREERVSPSSLITSNTASESFNDIEYAGHIDYITVAQFMRETAGELTEKEQKDAVDSYASRNNWQKYSYGAYGQYLYANNDVLERMPVLRFQYLTENVEKYVYRKKNKKGNPDIEKKKFNFRPTDTERPLYENGEKELIENTYTGKYGGSWIIGSDIVWDYGLKTSPREHNNHCDTMLDYTIFAPNMQRERVVSLLSQMIEPLFMINVAHNRIKDIVAKGYNGLISLNLDKLSQVSLGKGSDDMTTKELLNLMYQKGIVLENGKTNQYDQNSGDAVKFIPTGIEFKEYVMLLDTYLQQLRNITGINENSDGSTPKTNTLNGVMEMANESTNTVLDYLYHAYHSIYRQQSKNLLLLHYTKEPRGVPQYEFSIGLERRPTDEELTIFRTELQKNASIPLIEGGLTSADVIEVYHASKANLKLAEQLLVARVKKNQRRAELQKQQDSQLAMQSNMAAAKAKQEADGALIQQQLQADLQRIAAEKDKELAVQALKNSGASEVRHIANQGQVDVARQSGSDKILNEAQRGKTAMDKVSLEKGVEVHNKWIESDHADADREHEKEQAEMDREHDLKVANQKKLTTK